MSTIELGRMLREGRALRGESIREVAERADVAVGWLHAVEHGRIREPGAAPVCRVADALGMGRAQVLRAAGWLR